MPLRTSSALVQFHVCGSGAVGFGLVLVWCWSGFGLVLVWFWSGVGLGFGPVLVWFWSDF